MHPEQEAAIEVVSQGVDRLSGALMRVCNICEDDALDIVRNLPDLTTAIQSGDYESLVNEAVRRAKRPSYMKFDAPNPDEKYPGHPDYRPNMTTRTTFNDHAAQAMKPYITAILKRVAKDRNLATPDARSVQAVIDNIDWSKASYEAKLLPKRPSRSKLRTFFKNMWRPVDRMANSVKFEWFWSALIRVLTITMIWKMLWSVFQMSSSNYEKAISGTVNRAFTGHERWKAHRTAKRGWR